MSLSIIIPCFNEEKTVADIIDKVHSLEIENKEIIFIDDCSNDGTRKIIHDIRHKIDKIVLNKKNIGKGGSIISGLKYVTKNIVIIQDADLEYDPSDILKMYKYFTKKNLNALYGSRVLEKDRYLSTNFIAYHRVFFNHCLTLISNWLNGQKLTDAHTCYKMFSSSIIDQITLKENGFCFCPELTAKLSKLGIKIYEIPISYRGRNYQEGKKIKFSDGIKTLWALIKYNL